MSRSMPNLNEFRAGLRLEGRTRLPRVIKREQVTLAGHLFSGIVLSTPVLTGHARHNWMPQVGEPLFEEIEGVAGVDSTGDPFTAVEVTRMQRAQRETMEAPLGQAIYISNNAPYIERLEDGWSQKAPAGMCEVTVHSVLEAVSSQHVELTDVE